MTRVEIQRTESSDWLTNAYLLDDGHGTAVLIDGNGVAEPLLDLVSERSLTVVAVLVTHHHVDHVMLDGYMELAAPVLAHALTARELGDGIVDRTISDSEILKFGELEIEVMHTPGHAHGHLSFFVNGSDVFTADALFAGTVGGTRGPQATGIGDLVNSLRRLAALPGSTRVHPGHRHSTTIENERSSNVFLRALLANRPAQAEAVDVGGEPATLLLWGPDYDGTHKAWVRLADGTEHITGGSQVKRT
jgi:hydroxyacylglutathione hydrolase